MGHLIIHFSLTQISLAEMAADLFSYFGWTYRSGYILDLGALLGLLELSPKMHGMNRSMLEGRT
jgi:hypothetical protein